MLPLTLLLLTRANATDIDTYRPTGSGLAGEGGFQVVSPSIGEPGTGYGGFIVSYGANLVVPAGTGTDLQPALRQLFGARFVGGYNFGRALRVDLDVPGYPWVSFSDPDRSGPALGDIRARGVIGIVGGPTKGEGLALIPSLSVPTGTEERMLAGGAVGAGLGAAIGIRPTEVFFLSFNLGMDSSPTSDLSTRSFGSALHAGGGLEWTATDTVGVGLEIDADIDLLGPLEPVDVTPVELHTYANFGPSTGIAGTVGAGTGILRGVGTPDLRLVAGLVWRSQGTPPVRDADRDGLVDTTDRCPDDPEDSDGFLDGDGCPDLDDDGDGLTDALDGCRDRPEDLDGFEDLDGCPEDDNDRDGIPDSRDVCATQPGLLDAEGCPDADGDRIHDSVDECPNSSGPEANGGCPDTDGDGIPDSDDACPRDPAEAPADGTANNGCPPPARISGDTIVVRDGIRFVPGSLVLDTYPNPSLDAVARILNAHPEIRRIEIAGHTDADGDRTGNLAVSQARAEAVMKYLIIMGRVDPGRLVPTGYGDRYPIDTNDTAAGRARNRRVEFIILK